MKRQIWEALLEAGLTPAGAAGVMGNLQAESALDPRNLQNSFERSLGMTDECYTRAVDAGTYTRFVQDRAGYGLAQWTHPARKRSLLDFARGCGCSIGDGAMQVRFLLSEIRGTPLFAFLCSTQDTAAASDRVLLEYERPADTSSSVRAYRAGLAAALFKELAKQPEKSVQALAREVLSGDWGNGRERAARLTAAGYDYTAVQQEVNRLLGEASRTHTVVRGDTLSALAARYHTSVQRIVRDNRTRYPSITPDLIRIGWILEIRGGR